MVPLTDVPRILGRMLGRQIALGTVRRWAAKGVKGLNGKQVKLQTTRFGGRYYTSLQWLEEFGALTNGARKSDVSRARNRMSKSETRRVLAKFGITPHANQESLPDVPSESEDSRPVPRLLSGGEVGDSNEEDHGGGIDRSGANGAEASHAEGRLSLPFRRPVSSASQNTEY